MKARELNETGTDEIVEPNVYQYLDHRIFIIDQIRYLQLKNPEFNLVQSSGLSQSYISRLLHNHRAMTENAFKAIRNHLGLNRNEISFLNLLRKMSLSQDLSERRAIYNKIKKFSHYRYQRKNELLADQYIQNWYYPAIRELTVLKDFREDLKWIRGKLKYKITLTQVKDALTFLIQNGFVERNLEGHLQPSAGTLDIKGSPFRHIVANYHEQVMSLSVRAIFDSDKKDRKHLARTIALRRSDMDEVRSIIDEANEKLQQLEARNGSHNADQVVQVSMVAFSLTSEDTE